MWEAQSVLAGLSALALNAVISHAPSLLPLHSLDPLQLQFAPARHDGLDALKPCLPSSTSIWFYRVMSRFALAIGNHLHLVSFVQLRV